MTLSNKVQILCEKFIINNLLPPSDSVLENSILLCEHDDKTDKEIIEEAFSLLTKHVNINFFPFREQLIIALASNPVSLQNEDGNNVITENGMEQNALFIIQQADAIINKLNEEPS